MIAAISLGLERISQLLVRTEVGSLSVVLGVILCFSLLVNRYMKNRHMYALAAKIPGPPALPIIGNAHYFVGLDMAGFVEKLLNLKSQFGFPQKFWLGTELWVGLVNPKDLEAVLTSEHAVNKNKTYSFFSCQADGIFVASGNRWRTFRKLVNPAFHMKLLEQFVQVFNAQSEILVDTLKDKANGELFDIHEYLARCTLDMICGTQMGVKTKEQLENTSDFAFNLYKSTEIVLIRTHTAFLHPNFIFNLSRYHKQNQAFIKPLHRFAEEIIRQRKKDRTRGTEVSGTEDFDFVFGKKQAIFLDSILDTFPDKSVEELVYYITDMLIAGSDTTATAISFTLLMLAMHPDVQENVYKEQCDIFADLESPITLVDLNEMKYLEMVIKESLRICTIPGVVRHLTQELDIENYTLPVGTNAYLCFYAVHRDVRYWQHPDKFYPEHFTPELVASRPKYSYMPFSMGPRNCPGYKYGMLSMKSAVSHVIRRYKFTTPLKMEELKYKMSFMLEPVQGFLVNIHKRSLIRP